MKQNNLNNSDELKILFKIENMQNTDFMQNTIIDREAEGLGFTSDILLNDKFTLMDLGEMNGLEVYNKTERK